MKAFKSILVLTLVGACAVPALADKNYDLKKETDNGAVQANDGSRVVALGETLRDSDIVRLWRSD